MDTFHVGNICLTEKARSFFKVYLCLKIVIELSQFKLSVEIIQIMNAAERVLGVWSKKFIN